MKVLSLDCSIDPVSAALWEGDGPKIADAVDEVECHGRGAASRDLMSAVTRLIGQRGWRVSDLDGVVVTIGPGAFTGLRIGVSLVKGLVVGRRMPVVAVGTLDAVAMASGRTGPVAAVLDAGRGEIYGRTFACASGGVAPIDDEVLAPADGWIRAVSAGGPLIWTGNGAVRRAEAIRGAWGESAEIVACSAMTLAAAALRLGVPRLSSGVETPVAELIPRYVRRAAAETNWDRGVVGSRRRRLLGWDPAHGRA